MVLFQEIYIFHEADLNGGWKEDASHCSKFFDEDLKKCLDKASFRYTDLVLNMRKPFHSKIKMSNILIIFNL